MNIQDISVIISIVLMEGLLSVDNALVNAALAAHLPLREQSKAILFGVVAGGTFRLIALCFASFIIRSEYVKLLGAGYLVYLAIKHLCFSQNKKAHGGAKLDFRRTIASIALADMVFSVDNVIAAVGMSSKTFIVVIGVLAGTVVMFFSSELVLILMRRYPLLEKTAYVIVGFIGLAIFAEKIPHVHVGEMLKFSCIIGAVALTIIIEEVRHYKQRVKGQNEKAGSIVKP